jgi:site-specific DNA-methyltransferase (adenine-specific)
MTTQTDLFHEQSRPPLNSQNGDPELHQWFTPFWAAEMFANDVLEGLGQVGVIEPSCGPGAFLSAIPANLPAYGVDIDPSVAAIARENSGRQVIIGDFRTIELPEQDVSVIMGNPPFSMPIIDGFIDRSHSILPEDGVAAFILPAHVFSTAGRVMQWNERFSLDVKTIPRSLFSRISMPLVWAKFIKTQRRTLIGLMLFAEQSAVENMPKAVRRRLAGPGTWREAVQHALEALGGQASLSDIYRAVEPRRPSQNQFWRDKVRQILGLYFDRLDEKRWALPAALAA